MCLAMCFIDVDRWLVGRPVSEVITQSCFLLSQFVYVDFPDSSSVEIVGMWSKTCISGTGSEYLKGTVWLDGISHGGL